MLKTNAVSDAFYQAVAIMKTQLTTFASLPKVRRLKAGLEQEWHLSSWTRLDYLAASCVAIAGLSTLVALNSFNDSIQKTEHITKNYLTLDLHLDQIAQKIPEQMLVLSNAQVSFERGSTMQETDIRFIASDFSGHNLKLNRQLQLASQVAQETSEVQKHTSRQTEMLELANLINVVKSKQVQLHSQGNTLFLAWQFENNVPRDVRAQYLATLAGYKDLRASLGQVEQIFNKVEARALNELQSEVRFARNLSFALGLLTLLGLLLLVRHLYTEVLAPLREIDIYLRTFDEDLNDRTIPHQNKNSVFGRIARSVETISIRQKSLNIAVQNLEIQREIFDSILLHVDQGLCVYDADYRLMAWSAKWMEIMGFDPEWPEVGRHISEFIRLCAERGDYGDGDPKEIVEYRLNQFFDEGGFRSHRYDRSLANGRNVEVNGSVLPNGGLITTYSDMTERKQQEETIRQIALTDSLTKLANRNMFRMCLQNEMARAERDHSKVALALIDLDRFKPINDSYGHPIGDKVLVEVANRLSNAVRETDTVARLGGDEFAIILVGLETQDEVFHPLTRFIESISRKFSIDRHDLSVGASIGVSFFPDNDTDADELVRKADLALYEAKAAGRGVFRVYDQEVDARVRLHHQLEDELDQALENNEFHLAYQPQFDAATRELIGAEALLRWEHPERGFLSPAQFLEVAETSGKIVKIGDWVLQETLRTLADWKKRGILDIRLAANVSARQFGGDRFVDVVKKALQTTGADPRQLEIEITEETVAADQESFTKSLQQLKDLGTSVALDDFGTGYSSLSHLRHFPIDRLKIDRSFISQLEDEEQDQMIVRTIVSLGHNLGVEVVAEGVETEAQFDFLNDLGCDQIQGFLLGRPMLKPQFEEWYETKYLPSRSASEDDQKSA